MPTAATPADLSLDELKERSPYLASLLRKRLAPARVDELVSAARSRSPPEPPAPWDCCGSNCKPCVKELHRQASKVHDQVWADLSVDEDDDSNREPQPPCYDAQRLVTSKSESGSPQIELALEQG